MHKVLSKAQQIGAELVVRTLEMQGVTHVFGVPVAPENIGVENPAFDVTPARYITAIICEKGVAYPPFTESLKALASQ